MLDVLSDDDIDVVPYPSMTGTSQTLRLNVDTCAFEDQIHSVNLGDPLMITNENAVADFITETELTMMNLVDSIEILLMP